nr:uncharacterized protein LOC129453977 [Misgurnus anguillicaudatus]
MLLQPYKKPYAVCQLITTGGRENIKYLSSSEQTGSRASRWTSSIKHNSCGLYLKMTLFHKLRILISSNLSIYSFILSSLSFGMEALVEVKFSCPCNTASNQVLFWLVLMAPALFVFLLIFLFSRPFKDEYKCCSLNCKKTSSDTSNPGEPRELRSLTTPTSDQTHETTSDQTHSPPFKQTHFIIPFVQCLVPPVVWFFVVLYDGDYYACSKTDWSGTYVTDDELKIQWCKPRNSSKGGLELRDHTQALLTKSKKYSFILAIVFCLITLVIVGAYDLYKRKKRGETSGQ